MNKTEIYNDFMKLNKLDCAISVGSNIIRCCDQLTPGNVAHHKIQIRELIESIIKEYKICRPIIKKWRTELLKNAEI